MSIIADFQPASLWVDVCPGPRSPGGSLNLGYSCAFRLTWRTFGAPSASAIRWLGRTEKFVSIREIRISPAWGWKKAGGALLLRAAWVNSG